MKLWDAEFTREAVAAARGYVERTVAPLLARLDALERRFAEMPAPLPGRDGKDADPYAMLTMVREEAAREVAKIPVPKDGRDGLGFDDLTVEHDGERDVVLRFARGERAKEFRIVLPAIIDRGVWREGAAYEKGDVVSHGGELWIAQGDASERPGTAAGAACWRLAVRRGRDGKDAPAEAGRKPAAAVRSAGAIPPPA